MPCQSNCEQSRLKQLIGCGPDLEVISFKDNTSPKSCANATNTKTSDPFWFCTLFALHIETDFIFIDCYYLCSNSQIIAS